MKARAGFVGLLLVSTLTTAEIPAGALSPSAPQPVSPGSTARTLPSADICPTFSWGSPADFESFELAVFEAAPDGSTSADPDLKAVAVVTIAGGGRSWTPSVDRCPEPGRVHVWYVRGRAETGTTEWSSGSWFTSPSATGPDPQAISALLSWREGSSATTSPRPEAAGADRRSTGHGAGAPLRDMEGAEPELAVQGELIVGEITVLDEPGSFGRIVTDSEDTSHAFGRLRATQFKLFHLPGAEGATFVAGGTSSPGAEVFQIAAPGGAGEDCGTLCADLDVGTLLVERELRVDGAFTFSNGFSNYLGTGGTGFFEVPSLTSVRVDNNAADCGARPVMEVRLAETDSEQIGIQVKCGEFP